MDRLVVYAPFSLSSNWFLRCMMDNTPDWTRCWPAAGCWHEDEEEFIKIKEHVLERNIFGCHIITEFELVKMSLLRESFSKNRSCIKTTHKLEFLPTKTKLELTEEELLHAVHKIKPDVEQSQLEARLSEPKFEIDVTGLKLLITKKDEQLQSK